MSMLENGRLTAHALRTAAEAARFWPSTVPGETNIAYINGEGPPPEMQLPWLRWYKDDRSSGLSTPVPIEVPG